MANEPTYAQQVAQWRLERKRVEQIDRVEEIKREHANSVASRDDALAREDLQEAAMYDDDAERLEQEYRQLVPPPADPRLVGFAQKLRPFFEKYGQAGVNNFDAADAYVVNRMRIPRGSPAYFARMRDYGELYGASAGTPYSRNDELPGWKEAAKISGVDENTYAAAYHRAKNSGRIS